MREPIVSIARCKDRDWEKSVFPAVKEALDGIGGLETIVSLGDTVLIKPNLVSDRSYETGAVTNPAVIRATIRLAKEAGAKRVIVADGSVVGMSTVEAFKANNIYALEDDGAQVVDLKSDEYVWVTIPTARIFKRLRIPRTFLESNVVINVPVMKTHDALPNTLGLKNMKGIIHEQDKKRFHKWGLEQAIVDLNQVALPELTILDGTIGMEGLGPNYGDPVYLGVIMASTDTLALDTVATEAMGMDPAHVDYLCLAAQSGLGCADMHSIDIVGVPLEEIRRPFKQVSLSEGDYDQYGIKVIRQGACSGCNHFIETVVTSLIDKGRIEKLANTTIVYGQNAVPPEPKEGEDLILLGSCMRKYKNRGRYMPGCPPHPHDFEHRILS